MNTKVSILYVQIKKKTSPDFMLMCDNDKTEMERNYSVQLGRRKY